MIKMVLDTRNFDRALDEYMKFNKRNLSEVINTKLNFIARNATTTTKKVEPSKIDAELDAASRFHPHISVGQAIVNYKLKQSGKKTLHDARLDSAVEKLKKQRHRTVGFLRSGWLPAIRILQKAMRGARGVPQMDRSIRIKANSLGTAKVAQPNDKCYGEIENFVQGGKGTSGNVKSILIRGLQLAMDKEVRSMQDYIEKKMNPEIDKFNR